MSLTTTYLTENIIGLSLPLGGVSQEDLIVDSDPKMRVLRNFKQTERFLGESISNCII